MPGFRLGGATPRTSADSGNAHIPKNDERVSEAIDLNEAHLCQIIYTLADSNFTPFKWDDADFNQEKSILLQTLLEDLQLQNVADPAALSPFIKRLLNLFARAGLLQIELSSDGVVVLKWPQRVAGAETHREIGIWLREVGLDGFDPIQLQGARADEYLETAVDCILHRRPLHRTSNTPLENAAAGFSKSSAAAQPRTPMITRSKQQIPLTRGAVRQMEEMDSRLVTDTRSRHTQGQRAPDQLRSHPENRLETPTVEATLDGTGSSVCSGRDSPGFARLSRSSASSPCDWECRTGSPLPDALNDALNELALLGSRIFNSTSSRSVHNTTMERYRQLSRFVSQAGVSGTRLEEFDEEHHDFELSSSVGTMSEYQASYLEEDDRAVFDEQ